LSEPQKNKRKKGLLEISEIEELMAILEELKRKGTFLDIAICPRCMSARLRRIGSMSGDMSGQAAWTSPKYECLDCGWRGRLPIYATNRPFDKKSEDLVADVETTMN
jgi:hypothetical protein